MPRLLRLRRSLAVGAVGALLVLGGCAAAGAPAADRDPLEPMNRAVYRFNDALDRALVKPVAQTYQDYLPEVLRNAVGNVFGNLADVWTAANQLLQGKPREAISDAARVLINTTVGFAGLGDPASDMGFEKHREDFGQTLGRWGLPAGPYLVLPFFGPSSVRDAPGLGVDLYVGDPVLAIDSRGQRNNAYLLRTIETRASLLRAERVIEGAALDRYSFVRDAWLQRRRNQVYDGNPPFEPDDDPGPTPDAGEAPSGATDSPGARQ